MTRQEALREACKLLGPKAEVRELVYKGRALCTIGEEDNFVYVVVGDGATWEEAVITMKLELERRANFGARKRNPKG